MKFNYNKKDYAMVCVAILFGIFFINIIETKEIINLAEESTKVVTPKSIENIKDFPSTKEGTFIGTINGNQNPLEYGEKIVLFSSGKIPGLTLEYYPTKSRLVGGTPEMSAENIVIFDGKKHQIAYTFQRYSKQVLFFDGQVIAESNFELFSRQLTGFVTGVQEAYISELFDEIEIG